MAKCKGTITKLSGSVGGLTYRSMPDGGVCVSQKIENRKNTRTRANMTYQLSMGNVVALARLFQEDVMERFEGAANKVQARGRYLGLNLKGTKVYLTKQQKNSGCSVLVGQTISLGSLPPIEQHLDAEGRVVTNIRVTIDVTAQTTVGELAMNVLMLNPNFAKGDSLDLYRLHQCVSDDALHFYVRKDQFRLLLDPNVAELLPKQGDNAIFAVRDGFLCLAEPLDGSAAAFVHKRTSGQGRSWVSTQSLLCVNPFADQFTTIDALDAAVKSRGDYTQKDPSFLTPQPNVREYTLLVFSNDGLLGEVSPQGGKYCEGEVVTLTAMAKEGARFVRWTDNLGVTVSEEPVYRVGVHSDASYTAWFEQK